MHDYSPAAWKRLPSVGEGTRQREIWVLNPKPWILPPLSNSGMIINIWLYIALNGSPNIDCYWVGATLNPKP